MVATAPPGRQAVVNGFGSATTASAAAVLGGGGSGGGGSSKLLRSCPSLFMFMFRSRRNALVKRLWRQAALRGEPDDGDEDEAEENQAAAAAEEQQVKSWIKSAAHALFKRLTDDQLALLLDALDGAGASASPCLPLDTDLVNSKREREKKRILTHFRRLLFVSILKANITLIIMPFILNRDQSGRRPSTAVSYLSLAGTAHRS